MSKKQVPTESEQDRTQIAAPADDRTQISASSAARSEIAPGADDQTRIAAQSGDGRPPAAPRPEPAAGRGGSAVPVGTLINNNYEIKELITAGGMGEVFRGEQIFTGDPVAIKIVLQSLANDEKVAALFMREAKVLCQLSDQAIVRFHNFVHDAELDRFCLIMEYIEGWALSDHMREVGPLSVAQARALMHRVAKGLARAHAMNVIHRDLSPDNVMLRNQSVENAVLIDFGIAKSAEMAESTLHGQLAGKFKYISPEQLGHFGGHIGPRADIYGLGLLMAAALRGRPIDMGSSIVEAVNMRRKVPRLDDIDPALRPLITHLLEPDPDNRPAQMMDVVAMLDDPDRIPLRYRGLGALRLEPAMSIDVPGLQQPPGQNAAALDLNEVDPASATPFGLSQSLPPPSPPVDAATTGRGTGLRWFLVLLVFSGIGAFAAWQQGLIGPDHVAKGGETPDNNPEAVSSDDLWDETREGFLATWSEANCTVATRISSGPDAGTIAAYSNDASAFAGLSDGYEARFGARPAVKEWVISEDQCPVLSLFAALRSANASPPVLKPVSDVVQDGSDIVADLSGRDARPVYTAYISPEGGVFNLKDRMQEQPDGGATIKFGLVADAGGLDATSLIIAIATDQPLIATAAAVDGMVAASLMPVIEAEIATREDLRAGMAVAGFTVRAED